MKKVNTKKSLIIATVMISIVTILLIIFEINNFYLLFFKVNSKIASTTEFSEIVEDTGCNIIDVKNDYETKGVSEYLMTDQNNCPYLISYTSFNAKEEQLNFFQKLAKDVKENNEIVTGNTSVNFPNYIEYDTSGNFYKSVTSKKNVVIYASVKRKYRDQTRNLLKKMNCKYEPNWQYGKKILYTSPLIIIDIIFIVFLIIKWDRAYTKKQRVNNNLPNNKS